jgi:hypothetical protein
MNNRDCAKRAHLSFTDISDITRKHSGDDGLASSKKYSQHSQSLQLFQRGYSKLEVAIELELTDSEIIEEYKQFMVLNEFDGLGEFYDQTAGNMGSYLLFYKELKLDGISIRDAIEGVKLAQQLNQLKIKSDGLMREEAHLK